MRNYDKSNETEETGKQGLWHRRDLNLHRVLVGNIRKWKLSDSVSDDNDDDTSSKTSSDACLPPINRFC
ncbi:unnamed protein product [Enterobius vermicularis]|uniref:Uncharacterized protein n=1 Tax=Enterobius vermicularis TaxID=51028 RepID=A0A0N4VC79_ENTVE|nr:unnamed protein product [Enterobius vermicularis]